jgi:hypothetical protein
MLKLKLPRNYWMGLLIMTAAYTAVQFLFNNPYLSSSDIPVDPRQIIRWVNILLIYITGILVIRKMKPGWLLFTWNLVHIVLIAYLFLAVVYEQFVAPLPYGIRGSAAPIIEFLISPVFYMAMGLIYSGLYQKE